MNKPLREQKRDYLRAAVDKLKAQGMTQRAIAEGVDDTETSLSGKLGGSRGITDDYVDRFAVKYGIPFTPGSTGAASVSEPAASYGKVLVDAEEFQRMMTSTQLQNRLMAQLLDKVDELLKREPRMQQ